MAEGGPQFASLYVGDLHNDVTEAVLFEMFNAVGPVASIRVCRDSVTRRSLGYAYVNFHGVQDAERALDMLNYSSIKGRSCRIMWSQRDPSMRKVGSGNIYVKNLDKNIDNKALYDAFSLFGNILSCKVAADREGNSYGYGFIQYETDEGAQAAIDRMNDMQVGNNVVQVSRFVKRGDRNEAENANYTNLYIKCFPDDWDGRKLEEEFGRFGPIRSSAVKTDKKGLRVAFVDFESPEDAQTCINEMHMKDYRTEEEIAKAKEQGGDEEAGPDSQPTGKLFVTRVVSKFGVQKGNKTSGKTEPVNLYVKNLDEATDEAALRELFEPFGDVASVAAPKNEAGKSKGYGFVCFNSPDEATRAVTEMHLKILNGKPLYVGLAERREARKERLRQRYQPSTVPSSSMAGKGGHMPGFGMGPGMGMFGDGMPVPSPMGMMRKGAPMSGMMPQPMKGMMRPGMMPQAPMGGMMQGGYPGPMAGGMMPGGMMRPPMGPGGGPGMLMRPQRPPLQPLSTSTLAKAPLPVQKQMIGERLYMQISRFQPELAGKITGMMLEMSNSELLMLLESEQQLRNKADEALRVLSRAK